MGASCTKPEDVAMTVASPTPAFGVRYQVYDDEDDVESSCRRKQDVGIGGRSGVRLECDDDTPRQAHEVLESDKDTPRQLVAVPADADAGEDDSTPDMVYAPAPISREKDTKDIADFETQRSPEQDWMLRPVELPSLKEYLTSQGLHVSFPEVKIGRCLCSTNKSNVFKASWKRTDIVAKVVKSNLSSMSEADAAEVREISRKEMLHEVKLLCKLRHPSLVRFVGAYVDLAEGQQHVFLTEYCEAGDVENYVLTQKQRSSLAYKLPTRVALQWASSTAEALTYLHNQECPILHRDLKPLNLLLTKSLDLKLTDLGLSKVLPPRTNDKEPAPRMSGGIGTWRYMAPEVVRYEQYTDRADVYSFSLIMFFLFSGKQPFHDFCKHDTELILKAYLKGQEPRPTLDATIGLPELQALMQDSWRVVASERPSSRDCAGQLSKILAVQERSRKLNPVQALKATWKRAVSS
jgi:hypothetical protein